MKKVRSKVEYKILATACFAARLMLESGSEVDRVEAASEAICKHYCYSAQCFATLTGVMLSIENARGEIFSLTNRIENRNNDLHKVSSVLRLVEDIDHYSLESFQTALEVIQREETHSPFQIFWAHLLAAFFFVILFQGSMREGFVASLSAAAIFLATALCKNIKLESLFTNVLYGFVGSAIPCLAYELAWIPRIDIAIISALMLLVPGVAFVNSIRDLFYGDLVTAQSHLLEVALIGTSLALGSGIALKFFYI